MHAFPHLFTPAIRGKRLKNRIMSSGHDTSMPTDNLVNDALVAYHKARAEGGVGLIVLQVAGVHDSALHLVLMATDDACIDGYRRVAEACHAQAPWCCRRSSTRPRDHGVQRWPAGVAYSASAVPNERFRVPRELDRR
jgi:2,4-dienoyl-CoA reductase-like NADH-dependent reductase (Old Yellow Enzyme family)